jgi:hypothetical protein
MEKQKMYRHGEIGFLDIKELPKNLKDSQTKIIINGSHGNSHSIDNGTLYLKNANEYVIGYLVAKNTNLLHSEHGVKVKGNKKRVAKLPNGIYEIIKQNEIINNELKQVID